MFVVDTRTKCKMDHWGQFIFVSKLLSFLIPHHKHADLQGSWRCSTESCPDRQEDRQKEGQMDRYLFVKTICALLAFSLQQAASTLWSWVGVGHDNLVAMDHALVAVVLWVGGGEGRLMARAVRGMWVVLGLIPRWRQDHGEARASVTLPRSCVTCRQKDKFFYDQLVTCVV